MTCLKSDPYFGLKSESSGGETTKATGSARDLSSATIKIEGRQANVSLPDIKKRKAVF